MNFFFRKLSNVLNS